MFGAVNQNMYDLMALCTHTQCIKSYLLVSSNQCQNPVLLIYVCSWESELLNYIADASSRSCLSSCSIAYTDREVVTSTKHRPNLYHF